MAKKTKPERAPALSPASREQYMISLAVDLAEQQMREGTASSQVISHYLKLGTEREMLERTNLERKNELLTAKTEEIQANKNTAKLYEDAMKMFKVYQGGGGDNDEDL